MADVFTQVKEVIVEKLSCDADKVVLEDAEKIRTVKDAVDFIGSKQG
jgi:acyl carrier protein